MEMSVYLAIKKFRTFADAAPPGTMVPASWIGDVLRDEISAEEERELARSENPLLTIEEAARVSGYSASNLRRMIRDRKLPASGPGANRRVHIDDLPRKPGRRVASPVSDVIPMKAQVARAIARGG